MGEGGGVEEEIRKGALSLGASTPESWIRLAHCPKVPGEMDPKEMHESPVCV